jgi:hypothetical protein
MLGAGAESANKQGRNQKRYAVAETRQHITEAGERGPERENRDSTETFGKKAGRDLKARQRP